MPDALSKTIPIWCAVINRSLFPDDPGSLTLFTPPGVVSKSEHSQIVSRLPAFVHEFEDLQLDLSSLRQKIHKPLRPIWITRDSLLPDTQPNYTEFHPLVLCTASKRVHDGEVSGKGYIQGAGDDSEGWSHGLTPVVFWNHKEELLATPESDLPSFITKLIREPSLSQTFRLFLVIPPTRNLFIGTTDRLASQTFDIRDIAISCGPEESVDTRKALRLRYLHLPCREGKLGSRDLRDQILLLPPFIHGFPQPGRIFISSLERTDFAAGIALAILCLYFKNDGTLHSLHDSIDFEMTVDKKLIRQRLSWITTTMPGFSICRATLNAISDFVHQHPNRRYRRSQQQRQHDSSSNGSNIAEIIFDNLVGRWEFYRTLSENKRHGPHFPPHTVTPAGVAYGIATFEKVDCTEYRYTEEGTFQRTGQELTMQQFYIWKLESEQSGPTIAVYQVNREDQTRGDLYGRLQFEPDGQRSMIVCATAHCLCAEDSYEVTYNFSITSSPSESRSASMPSRRRNTTAVLLSKIIITNEVRGPHKDYRTVTVFGPQ